MKRTLILLLALALALTAWGAMAEEKVAMRIVTCEEQGFSTLCKPEYDYEFEPDGGLTVELGEEWDDPWISIFKTDAPGADFDATYYLNNVYLNPIVQDADEVMSGATSDTFSLGGKEMPGVLVMYRIGDMTRMRFCCFDLQDDYFVRYEGGSSAEEDAIQKMLTAVAVAVGNFQPDPNYYN